MMNRNRSFRSPIAVVCLVAVALSGCVMNKINSEPQVLELRQSAGGLPITATIVTGEEWSDRMQAGPFIFNVLPQFAIWAEDADGNLIETLYVTGADFRKLRNAQKHGEEAAYFAECLPVWASRVEAAGLALPSKQNPYPDGVTSATPEADVTIATKLPAAGGPITVYAELNKSGDENERFTEDNNDWAGQPSLLYRATIPELGGARSYRLELVGHGGMLTDDPGVYTDLDGFDTALQQVEEITIAFE